MDLSLIRALDLSLIRTLIALIRPYLWFLISPNPENFGNI
jgi:hypothetical protein